MATAVAGVSGMVRLGGCQTTMPEIRQTCGRVRRYFVSLGCRRRTEEFAV